MVHRVKNSDRYYASVAIPGLRTLRVAGFPQKRLTEDLERQLELLVAFRTQSERPNRELQKYLDRLPDRTQRRLVKLNLLDAQDPSVNSRRLEDVLGSGEKGAAPGQYGRYLTGKGDSVGHARQQAARARRILVQMCEFTVISEIAAEPVLQALAELREEGLASTTSNAIRTACRTLTKWLTRERRLPADPLAYLERITAESDGDRRALSEEEQIKLVHSTKTQPVRGGLDGEERSLLYLLALATGFRRGELLSLRRADFDLDAAMPTVRVLHGHAKNKKTARIPLQPSTVTTVRRHVAAMLPAALVFQSANRHYRAAEVLRYDLESAGIPERTEQGKVDFHALRTAFITQMARAGLPLSQAQKLARHCSPALTSNIYSKFAPDEDAAAIAKLPSLADAVG